MIELFLFTQSQDEDSALEEILNSGVSAISLKRDRAGSRYVSASEDITMPAFEVIEVDPTGAGDCFSATFLAGWLQGLPAATCLRQANAAGALAVSKRGPMEGASTRDAITHFLQDHEVYA